MSHIVSDVVIVPGLICLHFALVLGLVYGAFIFVFDPIMAPQVTFQDQDLVAKGCI